MAVNVVAAVIKRNDNFLVEKLSLVKELKRH